MDHVKIISISLLAQAQWMDANVYETADMRADSNTQMGKKN